MPTKKIIECDLKKLTDIIEYNENALGVTKDIHSGSLLNIKDEILYLVNFFSCIDNNFKHELLQQLINDVLHFLDIYEQLEEVDLEDVCKGNKECDASKESHELLDNKIKQSKLKVISIINTRLYCIDLLMWNFVKKSKKIKRFINIFEVGNVKNTQEFLKIQKYDLTPMFKATYIPTNENLKPEYKEEQIALIQTLKDIKEETYDEGIEKLLKVKKSIGFFENMSDEEIKLIVGNVKYMKCPYGEVLTKQADNSKEMFFILSGKCTVIQDNQVVGILAQKQLFGEFSKITNRSRYATVITKEPSTILSFNLRLELFDEAPFSFSTLYKNILTQLIKKIDLSNQYKHIK